MFSANVLHALTNSWCVRNDDVALLCELVGSFWLMFLLFSQMLLFEDFLEKMASQPRLGSMTSRTKHYCTMASSAIYKKKKKKKEPNCTITSVLLSNLLD